MANPEESERSLVSVELCVHAKLGELEPYMLVTVSAGPSFSKPEAGNIVRRIKCCAMCFGWIEAVTRFGLPLGPRK